MKFFKNKKGFTLVELVVVIAILGILAGIAIPRFMDATATARGAKIVADMRTLESAETMYYARVGSYTNSIATLVSAGLIATEPKAPAGKYIIPESQVTNTLGAETAYTVVPKTAGSTVIGKDASGNDIVSTVDGLDVKLGDLTLTDLLKKS